MKKTLLLLFCLLCPLLLRAERLAPADDSLRLSLQRFVQNIQTFSRLFPQEKVFLHFDNTGYFLGETIYFKAYVVSAATLARTPQSGVLYVELLDASGNIVDRRKLNVRDGSAAGDFLLKEGLVKTGFYEVRAYTRLQLNFDHATLFSRVFPIFERPAQDGNYSQRTIRLRNTWNQLHLVREKDYEAQTDYYKKEKKLQFWGAQIRDEIASSRPIPTASGQRERPQIRFYPEGGRLVQGISTKVAFRLENQWGKALEGQGLLLNAQGDTLQRLRTEHSGMGAFSHCPKAGEGTYVEFDCNGEKLRADLPEAEPAGCGLSLTETPDGGWNIAVERSDTLACSQPLGLTIQCRGRLELFKDFRFLPGVRGYRLEVPRRLLKSGVHQITLFTPQGEILAERLAFCDRGEEIRFAVTRDKRDYAPYEPVTYDFRLTDSNGAPVEGEFSLAIRDADAEIPTVYAQDLRTNLLLCSELRGFIENPAYYFEKSDSLHRRHLDLLLLTQGYRRYDWELMADVVPFRPEHRLERSLMVDGSIRSLFLRRGKKKMSLRMLMHVPDQGAEAASKEWLSATCPTDSAGNFSIKLPDFWGKGQMQLESVGRRGRRSEQWIVLNRLFAPRGRKLNWYDTYVPHLQLDRRLLVQPTDEPDSLPAAEPYVPDSLGELLATHTVKALRRLEEEVARHASYLYNVEEEENLFEDAMEGYNERLNYFLYRINPYFQTDGTYKGRPVVWYYYYAPSPDSLAAAAESGDALYLDGAAFVGNRKWSRPEYYSMGTPDIQDVLMGEGPLATGLFAGPINYFQRFTTHDVESIAILEEPALTQRLLTYEPLSLEARNSVVILVRVNPYRMKNAEPVGIRFTTFEGFSRPSAFFSPDYSQMRLPDERDYRRTLYWNPAVRTDSAGQARVKFYNNGTCRRFSLSAAALTAEGMAGAFRGE